MYIILYYNLAVPQVCGMPGERLISAPFFVFLKLCCIFGKNKQMKHAEENLQINCVKWFNLQYPNTILHHSPNGGKRNAREAARFKRMGTLSGFPDLFLAKIKIIDFGYGFEFVPGLFIELKSEKGTLTENQKKIHKQLKKEGYHVVICRTFEEFVRIIENYLAE